MQKVYHWQAMVTMLLTCDVQDIIEKEKGAAIAKAIYRRRYEQIEAYVKKNGLTY